MGGIVASVLVHVILQVYAIITLMLSWSDSSWATILLFVILGGAATSASIVGCCIRDINSTCFSLIGIIALLNILPFCVGFLSSILPSAVYGVIKTIYIIIAVALGVVPTLAGGAVYLISGIFTQDEEVRMVIAFIPILACGIAFGLWIENKLWTGGSADATVYDSDGTRHDIFFH